MNWNSLLVMDESDLRRIIEDYFHQGYGNRVIVDFLKDQHGAVISLATLKGRLRGYGLRRRGSSVDDQQLRILIQSVRSGPGELQGYRSVWHSLRIEHHVHVSRQRVANILRELNPQGVQQGRRRRLKRRRQLFEHIIFYLLRYYFFSSFKSQKRLWLRNQSKKAPNLKI